MIPFISKIGGFAPSFWEFLVAIMGCRTDPIVVSGLGRGQGTSLWGTSSLFGPNYLELSQFLVVSGQKFELRILPRITVLLQGNMCRKSRVFNPQNLLNSVSSHNFPIPELLALSTRSCCQVHVLSSTPCCGARLETPGAVEKTREVKGKLATLRNQMGCYVNICKLVSQSRDLSWVKTV